MTDRLLIQSIGSNPHDTFKKYMALQEPIHRDYAARCGADYEYFVGESDARCNPTWNRVRMMLDAFDRGYRKIVWLDADCLVVRPDDDVFDGTSDSAPLLMTRVLDSHVEMPWKFNPAVRAEGMCGAYRFHPGIDDLCGREPGHAGDHLNGGGPWPQWDVYNDGVLIVNDSDHARAALEFAWARRLAPFKPWHIPGMPELDWLLDYVFDHPDAVEQLHDRWNWIPYPTASLKEQAAILAWHGYPHEQRWVEYQAAYEARYGGQ